MKISLIPTEYFLIKASTNSEWDECSFAIIHITQDWKKTQQKRIESVNPLSEDYDLKWLNYADTNVDFYKFSDELSQEVQNGLSEGNQFFIGLTNDEIQTFSKPENRLNCYQMQVFKNGNAIYNAFGKHTGEEFFTEEFSLQELIDQNF